MLVGLLAALAAAVAFGVAALLQALASRAEPRTGSALDPRLLLRLLRRPTFLAAVGLTLVGAALHLVALRALPLFLAQTVVSASVAVTAVVGTRLLRITLHRGDVLAVVAVCAGLALLTATAEESEGVVTTTTTGRALLLGAVVVVLVAGGLAGRLPGAAGAGGLGLVAGLGFAVVAVAARVLPSLAPGALLREPAAYAIAVGGPVAFLLYSTALQRASVLVGTSATVVGQTVAPALVGLLLLGDRVQDGTAPVLVAGLLLAVVGAGVLARLESAAAVGG
ncbi:MAG: hypothetical protein H7323_03620 [Frankiales bacterium]|nr:hypothetical protein [Frankiales bacterium]